MRCKGKYRKCAGNTQSTKELLENIRKTFTIVDMIKQGKLSVERRTINEDSDRSGNSEGDQGRGRLQKDASDDMTDRWHCTLPELSDWLQKETTTREKSVCSGHAYKYERRKN